MSINILDDLTIAVVVNQVNTKTITGQYDVGAPGTYLPGIDCSPTDDVSAGVTTSYQLGISLSSKSNQTYPIDRLFLQSADDPQTNGTGIIPFYLINNDPNPENTTDDMQYTLLPNYHANMTSVVLGPDAGITSTSTISLTLNVNYPDGVYWKTKIAPKINACAVKDGITAKSDLLRPKEVRMSSTSILENNLYYNANEWNGIRLTTVGGQKGFNVPFYLQTSRDNPDTLATLLDSPNPDTITYQTNITFSIDDTNIPVLISQITNSLQGGQPSVNVQSITMNGTLLTVVLKRNSDISFPVILRVVAFLPYDPGAKTTVTMKMKADWNIPGVVFNNWQNAFIFSESTIGGFDASVIIPLTFVNPSTLLNNVSALVQSPNTIISSVLSFYNIDFISMASSKLLLLCDSEVASISDATPFMEVTYTPLGEVVPIKYNPPASAFLQQYAYVPLPAGYDPNTLGQSVFNGSVTLGTYAQIVALGHTPNVLMTTVLSDILAGLPIDFARPVSIAYQKASMMLITNDEFFQMYQAAPAKDFTSHLYTLMQVGTSFASVTEAYTLYGTQLGTGDSFINNGSKVLLSLATSPIGQLVIIRRFNATSEVRADIKVPVYRSYFQTSISYNGKDTIPSIFDYTQTYPLRFSLQDQTQAISADGRMLAGPLLSFAIPSAIVPYLYLAGTPAIYDYDQTTNTQTLVATIVDYGLLPGVIQIVLPQDVVFTSNNMERIFLMIPVGFIPPSQDQVFNHENTTFDPNRLLLAYPNQLVTDFPSSSPYYIVQQKYVSSTLQGAGVDFSGLTVNRKYYPSGEDVTFIATIKNQSASTDEFYMGLTVPTNKYNPLETSNNTQLAFIDRIVSFYPSMLVYYQTATKATQQDIDAMKKINVPGTNLKTFYNTVVTSTWTQFNLGDILPNDVVMIMAYARSVPTGESARIDYRVKVQMDPNTTETYINDGAFNYYSNASQIETQSNKVTIQNYNPLNPIVITKAPETQTVLAKIGQPVQFTIVFDVPLAALDYTTLSFSDALPKSLTLLSTSTMQIDATPAVALNATVSSENVVTKLFDNPVSLAGKQVTIVLNAEVSSLETIPDNARDTNQAQTIIDGNPDFTSTSNTVELLYQFEDLFNIQKTPLTRQVPKVLGTAFNFTITFNVPSDITNIQSIIFNDQLAPAIVYDPDNSYLQIGDTPLGLLQATSTNNNVVANLDAYINQAAGKEVKITVGVKLADIGALPSNNTIENRATIMINNIPAYHFTSNDVTVTFASPLQPLAITKRPFLQQVEIVQDAPVVFTLAFTLPQDVSSYQTVTFSDTLAACLSYDDAASTVQFGVLPATPLLATVTGNTVTKVFDNLSSYAGMNVVITLATKLTNSSAIPVSNSITNVGQLIVNGDSALTSTSNEVTVTFVSPLQPIAITKRPLVQQVDIVQDAPVVFTLSFTLPRDVTLYQTITFSDTLAACLSYDATASTVQFGALPATPLLATVTGNTVSKVFTNLSAYAGMEVIITLATKLTNSNAIPVNNTITNVGQLVVNEDSTLTSTSNEVTVTFVSPLRPIAITKRPLVQRIDIVQDTPVVFTLTFTLPQDVSLYQTVTFSDTLAACLSYDATASTVQFGTLPATPLLATVTGNTVTKVFNNLSSYAGMKVVIKLATKLTNLSAIPANKQITNIGQLVVNDDSTLSSMSNQVIVIFKIPNPHQPAINDIIESVALMQTGISHILNAEGEKIQKALQLPALTQQQLLDINQSVTSMVNSITALENILVGKLEIVDCGC